ncbi:hypothetical protein [Actinomadura madurae]|uniref:hypothetical protein n=1 Tax=Actinomadura madurae TaxID=1993 RepID=UPI0020D23B3D|nr:hypothetical protein [Actinomadura madurae]MCP9947341.1 hypothetical protein [Actinomadura madurae]MCP9964106.1 hypothetical protein [Actinomadura madurae]MCP9976578.1 hypothetical protein [Actinomadura madurae]MCQ0011925.1 hypothetical protein [Actinomadura madurae]MCQ0012775.1 hypothetical protein [Actinomadura madurae]
MPDFHGAALVCPSCGGEKSPRHYVCRPCWRLLPAETQRRLYRKDPAAFRRLSDLHEQLRNNMPLNEIEVSS